MEHRWYLPLLTTIFFLVYIIIQSRAFLFAPTLSIEGNALVSMKVGEEFILKGQANKLSEVRMNGEQISLTPKGTFSQKLLVQPGRTTIEVVAISRFNKQARKTITLIGSEP